MSAQIIGTVQTVIGHVIAINKDGEVRELKSGDVLLQGETIKTGPDGSATILYANGLSQTIDSDADIKLNLAMADTMAMHAAMPIMHPLTSAIHSAVLAESGLPKLFPDLKLAPMLASEGDHAAYVRPYLEPLGLIESGYPTHGIPFGKMVALDVKGWPFLHHEIQIIPPVLLSREVLVQESGLPGGSSPSFFDRSVSGSFTISDPSHVIQLFDVLHINGGAPVLLSALNNFHVMTPHGDLALSYDSNTHTFSFLYELTSSIDKLLALEQDVFSLSLSAGPFTVNGQLIVNIVDDKPSVSMSVDGEFDANLLTHDAATIGAAFDTASANFSSAFSALPIYGADDPGATWLSYTFNLINSASGLKSGGLDINLFKVGNMIIGTTANSAPAIDPLDPSLIFTIAVDGSGNVTLTQYAQLDHALPGDSSNYDSQHLLLPGNLIHLIANAVTIDSDGMLADRAFAIANLDLGGRVLFADDGPVIEVGVRDDSEILLTTHDAATPNSASANFGSFFTIPVQDPGADAPGGAVTGFFALELMGADGALSNLKSHGASIYLYKIGDAIVGSTATAAFDVSGSNTIFSVTHNGDEVTLTQYAPIDHALPGDGSNYNTQHAVLDAGLIKLVDTVTETDFDGDTATASNFIDLGGNLRFADDGPFVLVSARGGDNFDSSVIMTTHDALTIGSAFDTATADFSGYFSLATNYGADGSGSIVTNYALSLINSVSGLFSGGLAITLYDVGGVIVGSTAASSGLINAGNTIFSIAVNSTSSDVTLTQFSQIDHPSAGSAHYDLEKVALTNGLVNLVATAVITDFDGDTATNSNHIDLGGNIKFADDGPSGSITLTGATVVVDETPGVNGPDTSAPMGTLGQTVVAYNSLVTDNILFGADGPASSNSKTFALQINGGDGTASGFLYSPTNASIVLVNNAGVIEGRVGTISGALAFTVAVDVATGQVTLTQYLAVEHSNTSSNDELSSSMSSNVLQLVVTATDYDGDSLELPALDLGSVIKFKDDGPSGSIALKVGAAVVVDETPGVNGSDTSAPVGTLGQSVVAYSSLVNDSINFGSDGPASSNSKVFALNINGGNGTASGLLYSATNASIVLVNNAGVIEGHVGTTGGALAFTVAVDSATGQITLTQYLAVEHSNASSNDELSSTLSANVLQLLVTATDADGDSLAPPALDLGSVIQFRDDGPSVLAKTNLYFQNADTVSGTGVFSYLVGSDNRLSYSSSNSDFSAIQLTGTVGGVAITAASVSWASESASQAVFNVSFNYSGGTATGTLTFDKVAGTYTVDFADPFTPIVINSVSSSTAIAGYEPGTTTVDTTQPGVAVAQLGSNLFIQFTGYAEPGAGTGSDNLQAGSTNPGAFTNGELITQASTWVSISGNANGVAGDTMSKGEVLDMDFFLTNPKGDTMLLPTAYVNSLFFKLDGIGNSEDFLVILKLYDSSTSTMTTKSLLIENSDMFKGPGSGPGAYSGVTLDNNDALVIIERNDYNFGSENWVIVGAQVLTSSEGITGTAINFNGAIGTAGASSGTQAWDAADNDVVKISDIGFVTTTVAQQNADLNFQYTVTDADGDSTSTQSLDVHILNGTTYTGSSGNDTMLGSTGDDTMTGSSGSDTLTGGTGADTFVWNSGDQGTVGSPAVDTVMDFSMTQSDKIDLSSLLPSGAVSNPQNYLLFSTSGSDTILKIDVGGAVSGSNFEQEIVFHNVSMATLGGAPSPTSAQVISNMITTSHLVV